MESSQSLRRYPGKPESPWSSSVCAESSSEGEDESMVSLVRMYGGGPGSRRNLHPIELKLAAIEKVKNYFISETTNVIGSLSIFNYP